MTPGDQGEFDRQWQSRLLPMISKMIVGLTIFFFAASFLQLLYLHAKIETEPQFHFKDRLEKASLSASDASADDALEIMRWQTLTALEEQSMNRAYHQGKALLMARIWVRYLSFVTGMILCLVGASFVLGKLKESSSHVEGKNPLIGFSIQSSSPGLILAVLGTTLMLTSVLAHHRITISDESVFLKLHYLDLDKSIPDWETQSGMDTRKNNETDAATYERQAVEEKDDLMKDMLKVDFNNPSDQQKGK